MSDPITDIIYEYSYYYEPQYADPDIIVKKIRQQLGRELLEHSLHDAVESQIIRKVCQMEEQE